MTCARSIRQRLMAAAFLTVAQAACGPYAAGDDLAGESILAAGPGRAPDPGEEGPYEVGVRTVWIEDRERPDPVEDGRPRRMRVEIWYPAHPRSADEPRDVVSVLDEVPAWAEEELEEAELSDLVQPAVRAAEPRRDQGEFPVIVFSHGRGGIRFQSFGYTAHLASHGYVVLAPDHPGDTLFDFLTSGDPGEIDLGPVLERPHDISLVIDGLEDGTIGSWLTPLLDLDRVGVTGHSMGGLVSVMMTSPATDFFDERLDASVPVTPATSVLETMRAGDLSLVSTPILYVGATDDRVLDYESETVRAFERHEPEKAMAGVMAAGHYSFTEACDLGAAEAAGELGMTSRVEDLLADGCGGDGMPVEVAQARLGHYAAGWFNAHLRGSGGTIRQWLDPHEAHGDVEYRVELSSRPW